MELIPLLEVITADAVCHGCQIAGSDAPKSATTGRPKAAAMWAGPLSFPTKSAAPANKDFTSSSDAPETHVYRSNAARLSPAPPIKIGSIPRLRWICSATARKFENAQVLSGADAMGCKIAYGHGLGLGVANRIALGISRCGTPRKNIADA